MSPTRRTLLAQFAALAAAGPARAADVAAPVMAYVGASGSGVAGVHPFRFDPATCALIPAGPRTEIASPMWLALDSVRGLLFVASEVEDYGPARSGSVSAFAIHPATGALRRINTVGSGGPGPTYISVHPTGRFLFVANYPGGSVAVLRVAADGTLSEPVEVQKPPRSPGYDPARTLSGANLGVSDHARPHMHMVRSDPSGRFVLADDAGSDRICVWRFDAQTGRLSPAATPFVATPAGSAPRHFVFAPDGRSLFDLQEHDNVLAAYAFAPETGALTSTGQCSTLPDAWAGSNLSSELAISADGRLLWAANRLRNTITTLAVKADGRLRRLAETWVEGDYPRSFGVDPTGRFLVCCNQRSDNLTSFRIDPATGALAFTGRFDAVPGPAAVVFHPLRG